MIIKHDGCWSEITSSLESSSILDMNVSVNYVQGTTNASVMLNVPKNDDIRILKNFMRHGKSGRSVKAIVDLSKSRNHNLSFVNFIGVYKGTIVSVLYEEGSPFFRYFFENGKEYWTFIVYSNKQLDDIKERLSDMATIYTIHNEKASNDNIFRIVGGNPENLLRAYMTRIQRITLLTAYNNGYFEIPHEITTYEISEILHLSPSTANAYIRHSEKKIMDIFLQGQQKNRVVEK